MPTDRTHLAQIFRVKSDDALGGAVAAFQNECYRSACNRAWYATYEAITAGVYAKLTQNPQKDRDTWDHNHIENLFSSFLRETGTRMRHYSLLESLSFMRLARVNADYLPEGALVSTETARTSIDIAHRIRTIIWEALQWPPPVPPVVKSKQPSESL